MQSMEFSRPRILELVAVPSPGDLPNPGIEHRPPALQAGSLPAEPLGKPKNTGVGSLSLLLQIFPTQELSQGLLHCRWILYPLSYEPSTTVSSVKLLSRVRLFTIPRTVAYQAPPSMEFPGKSTGVGCHFFLQGIFPTQGLNPGILHWQTL